MGAEVVKESFSEKELKKVLDRWQTDVYNTEVVFCSENDMRTKCCPQR